MCENLMSTYLPETATGATMRRFSVKPGFSISSGVWPPRGAPVDETLDAVGVRLEDGRIGIAARSEGIAPGRVDNPGNCGRAGEAGGVAPKVGPAFKKEVVLEIVRWRLRRGNLG